MAHDQSEANSKRVASNALRTIERDVVQLDGRVTHLARDYRTLARTLRGH